MELMVVLDRMRDLVYCSDTADQFRTPQELDAYLIDCSTVLATAPSKHEVYAHVDVDEQPRQRLQQVYHSGTYHLVILPEGVDYSLALYCSTTQTAPESLVPTSRLTTEATE